MNIKVSLGIRLDCGWPVHLYECGMCRGQGVCEDCKSTGVIEDDTCNCEICSATEAEKMENEELAKAIDQAAREDNCAKKLASNYAERLTSLKKGQKFDDGRAPVWRYVTRYFPRSLLAIAMVGEYGGRKYAESNDQGSGWQDVPNALHRYSDAEERHALKRIIEGEYDESDSGLAHLAQKAWNSLAVLELALRDGVIECRRGNEIELVDGKPKPVLGTAKAVKL